MIGMAIETASWNKININMIDLPVYLMILNIFVWREYTSLDHFSSSTVCMHLAGNLADHTNLF